MYDELRERLLSGGTIILDGGTGTELQRRGVYKTSYVGGTLRQKLFGRGDRLAASHPAARFRRS